MYVPQCACGEKPIPLEEADWVNDSVPYCHRPCYDRAINALVHQAFSCGVTAEEKAAVLAFHVPMKE